MKLGLVVKSRTLRTSKLNHCTSQERNQDNESCVLVMGGKPQGIIPGKTQAALQKQLGKKHLWRQLKTNNHSLLFVSHPLPAADPLVGNIATQFLHSREDHDRAARQWTERYATWCKEPPQPVAASLSSFSLFLTHRYYHFFSPIFLLLIFFFVQHVLPLRIFLYIRDLYFESRLQTYSNNCGRGRGEVRP